MEVESSLSDFNRKSNNVGRFKGGLWGKIYSPRAGSLVRSQVAQA